MTTDKQTMLYVNNVSKKFTRDRSTFYACKSLSFDIAKGETVAIVGETGCGKSTVLALLLGLIAPTSGEIDVLGVDPFRQFRELKGRIGIIFQKDRLLPWRTAVRNIEYGLEVMHVPKARRRELAHEWLSRVGLAQFANSYPHQLSGGMRQRVSIARTFAMEPDVLFADETFSALDEITAATLRHDLVGLIKETKKTTLFITHSVSEAADLADRVLVFGKPGHVVLEVKVGSAGEGMSKRSKEDVENEIRHGLRMARDKSSGNIDKADSSMAKYEKSVHEPI